MADENAWINYDFIKELAEKLNSEGKKDREDEQRQRVREEAENLKFVFDTLMDVGFTDDQALQILLASTSAI